MALRMRWRSVFSLSIVPSVPLCVSSSRVITIIIMVGRGGSFLNSVPCVGKVAGSNPALCMYDYDTITVLAVQNPFLKSPL